mgnify:CR=1 FL=1
MALVEKQQLDNGVIKINLNDPENLNAMSDAMANEFSLLIKNLKDEEASLRMIILSGSGRAFSAGGDLSMLEAKTKINAEENRALMMKFYQSFLGILQIKVPLVAAINGHAIGAGLCLASACDIRICSDKAKLGFTFVKLGLHPGMGATYFLPRILGDAAARELLFSGRIIDAAEALKIGLVSKVVSSEQLDLECANFAKELLTSGPQAVSMLVDSLRNFSAGNLQEALEREASCQAFSYASQEFKEGVRAAIEKRKPIFS